MVDPETLNFLRQQSEHAKYITSVCNGSLILAAAGLLDGYKTACHWMWSSYLERFGAQAVDARVVRDRNHFSGGGVTAGIDFALTLAAEIAGKRSRKEFNLLLNMIRSLPLIVARPLRRDLRSSRRCSAYKRNASRGLKRTLRLLRRTMLIGARAMFLYLA